MSLNQSFISDFSEYSANQVVNLFCTFIHWILPDLSINFCHIDIWATSWENLFMPYANNKGADQFAHPRSLISTFVVHCHVSVVSSFYIRNFKPLATFCGCAGRFESYLVENPEDRFSRDEDNIILTDRNFPSGISVVISLCHPLCLTRQTAIGYFFAMYENVSCFWVALDSSPFEHQVMKELWKSSLFWA